MAKILAYTIEKPGHYPVFVPILHELKRRGHAVRLVLFSSDTKHPLAGIEARRVNLERKDVADYRDAVRRRWPWEFERFGYYGEPVANKLKRIILVDQPDIILVDPMLWGGMVCAEASGLPWVSIAHNPMLFRGSGLDVRGPGLSPPKTKLEASLRRVVDITRRWEEDSRYLPAINSVRGNWGLRPLRHWDDIYVTPPLILVTSAPPFEYPRNDWPKALHFVGPIYWEYPRTLPGWIKRTARSSMVLITSSSIQDSNGTGSWERKVMQALAASEYNVLATLPTRMVPKPDSTNVKLSGYLPHSKVLPYVRCVVCHGGPGIVHKSLAGGVPVVAIPELYDRFEVARRLDNSRSGVSLHDNEITRESLLEAVGRAIGRTRGAQTISEAFKKSGGAARAANLIETTVP